MSQEPATASFSESFASLIPSADVRDLKLIAVFLIRPKRRVVQNELYLLICVLDDVLRRKSRLPANLFPVLGCEGTTK